MQTRHYIFRQPKTPFTISTIHIIIVVIIPLTYFHPRQVFSQNLFDNLSDDDVICTEMEKNNQESCDGRRVKSMHDVLDVDVDDLDDDDDDDDDTDVQNEKHQPSLTTNSSRFVRNYPVMVTVYSDILYRGVIIQARIQSTGSKLGRFIDDPQTFNQSTPWKVDQHGNSTFKALRCSDKHKFHHHSHTSSVNLLNKNNINNNIDRSDNINIHKDTSKDTMFHWSTRDEMMRSSYLWVYDGEDKMKGEFVYFIANVCSGRMRCWKNITSMVLPFDQDIVKIDTSECGRSKGCFRYPGLQTLTCDWMTCQYLLTYYATDTEAHFEMSGKSAWIAVGFSSDNRMGGDDVYMCVRTRSGVVVRRYVTELGHVTPTLIEKNPFYNMEGSAIGVEWSANPSNVTLTCRFSRPLKVMYDQSSVDLSATWYQLYAWGLVSSSDTILRHILDKPLTSKAKMTLRTSRDEVESSCPRFFISSLFAPLIIIVTVFMTYCQFLCGF